MSADPNAPQMGGLPSLAGPSGLGNLAREARAKKLKQAKTTLMVIGVLTMVVNGAQMGMMREEVKKALAKEVNQVRAKGMIVDPVKLQAIEDSAVRAGQLIVVGFVLLGALFIVFGAILQKFPVPISVASLVLYIGAAALMAYFDPATLAQALIFKVIVIAGLVAAVRAAIAAQNEESQPTAQQFVS